MRDDESVSSEIEGILAQAAKRNRRPETMLSMGEFVTSIYLPFATEQKRPFTSKGYREMWEGHLRPRCETVLLRDVRTCHVQTWLKAIAAQDKTKTGASLRRETLKRIKSCLSGMFSHAKQQGFFDGVNSVVDTAVPSAPSGADTYAYSLGEINKMLLVVLDPAGRTIIATVAFTGARRGEIEGMLWENWRDGGIYITRSKWNRYMLEPKTGASKAPVPIIPTLAAVLQRYRELSGNPISGVMFPAVNGKPVSLNNVLNRKIKPALRKAGIEWHGWHAFRRELATNLHDLGVDDKTIQAILRHSDVSVTQRCYIKTLPKQSIAAMNAFEASMCAGRAPQQVTDTLVSVN